MFLMLLPVTFVVECRYQLSLGSMCVVYPSKTEPQPQPQAQQSQRGKHAKIAEICTKGWLCCEECNHENKKQVKVGSYSFL
jgi:hypothetical protein